MDALSDDGRHGLTLIAFIGSVFSPYYAWARASGPTDPLDHCAVNVALYGIRGSRWSMTERGRRSVARSADELVIGPSRLHWDGHGLTAEILEWTAPWPTRLRGRIRLLPAAVGTQSFALDAAGRHRWTPFAPCARIEVSFEQPSQHWQGDAYFDHNQGDRPLEQDFSSWTWSRCATARGTQVLYDLRERGAAPRTLALDFDASARATAFAAPPPVALPATGWRLARSTNAQPGERPRILRTLEDAPFYARSLLTNGEVASAPVAMHESLSLERFAARWVQCLLPFRMPRRR